MATVIKDQFNPSLAAFGMPSKGMLSAIGDSADEYEKQKKLDRMFALEEKSKNLGLEKDTFAFDQAKKKAPYELENAELDTKDKRFRNESLNPLKLKTEENQANTTALALEKQNFLKDKGVWNDEVTKSKNDLTVSSANAAYAKDNAALDNRSKEFTMKVNELKLQSAKSDDIVEKTASFFYTDKNGDGVIDDKDFAVVTKELSSNPNVNMEQVNKAYMMARERTAKLNELISKEQKNLGVTHKQGTVSDKVAGSMASKDMIIKNTMDAIELYDPANTGVFDNMIDSIAANTVNWGDAKGRTSYRQAVGRLASQERNELFGSALTKGETEFSKSFLPSLSDSEEVAKQKLLGFLQYQSDLVDSKYATLDPTKKAAYKETYEAMRSDLDEAIKNAPERFGIRRAKPTTTSTEANGTKGATQFSASRETNTSKPAFNPRNY